MLDHQLDTPYKIVIHEQLFVCDRVLSPMMHKISKLIQAFKSLEYTYSTFIISIDGTKFTLVLKTVHIQPIMTVIVLLEFSFYL